MSRVTLTEITQNADLSITAVNATLSEWATDSAAIDHQNVADEGIDGRNIVADSVYADQTGAGRIFSTSSTTVINVAALTVVTIGTPVQIGPFTYSSASPRSDLRVVCAFEITDDTNSATDAMEFQLYRSVDNGATWSAMADTLRIVTAAWAIPAEHSPRSVKIVRHENMTGTTSTLLYRLYARCVNAPARFISMGHVEFFTERRMK